MSFVRLLPAWLHAIADYAVATSLIGALTATSSWYDGLRCSAMDTSARPSATEPTRRSKTSIRSRIFTPP